MAKLYKSTNDYKSFLGWYGECGDCSPVSIDDYADHIFLVYEWSEGGYARKWKSSLIGTGLNSSLTEFNCGHAYYIMLKKGEGFIEIDNLRISTNDDGSKDFGRLIDAEQCETETDDETESGTDEDTSDENDEDTTPPDEYEEEVGLEVVSIEVDDEATENNVTITVKLQKDTNHWHYSINDGDHKMVYNPSATFTMQEGDTIKFYEVVVKDGSHTKFGEEQTYSFESPTSNETGMSFEIENSKIIGFKLRVKLKNNEYMKTMSDENWEMETDTDLLVIDGDELDEIISKKDEIKYFELRTIKNKSFDKNTCYTMQKEKVFRYPPMKDKIDKSKNKRKKFIASNISSLTTEFIQEDGSLDVEEINNLIGETSSDFDISEVINDENDVRMEDKEKPIFKKIRDRMTILIESINIEEMADEDEDEDVVERHDKIMQRIRRPRQASKKLFEKDSYKLMVDDLDDQQDFADSVDEVLKDIEEEAQDINVGIYMENFQESVKRDFPEMGVMKDNSEGKPPKRKRMSKYKKKSDKKRKEMRQRRKEFAMTRECNYEKIEDYTKPSIMQGVFVDTIEILQEKKISVKVTLLEGATHWAYIVDSDEMIIHTETEIVIDTVYAEFDLKIFAVESEEKTDAIGRIFDKTIDTRNVGEDTSEEYYEDKEDYIEDKDEEVVDSEYKQLMVNDLNREYVDYVPSELVDGASLIINFHGFGGNAQNYAEYTKMNELAETEKFVVVYPQAVSMQIEDKEPGIQWNVLNDSSKPDDIAFVDGIINKMAEENGIDTNSVYVTGFSNGGMFAFALATYMKDSIKGIANVCGTSLTDPVDKIDVLSIHGNSDAVVPFQSDSIQAWASINGFEVPGDFNSPEKYESNDAKIEIHLLDMGHEWKEGSEVIGGKSINKYIYDFFMSSVNEVVVEDTSDDDTLVEEPDNSNMEDTYDDANDEEYNESNTDYGDNDTGYNY